MGNFWDDIGGSDFGWTFFLDPVMGATSGAIGSSAVQPGMEVQNPYYDETGWHEGGPAQWNQDHHIDPLTGELVGPTNVVPWHFAREIQGQHEKAVAQRRQRMMQEGINYQKGALGLLQSYRAGGSAALEANTYGQLGQMQFQRASMTQSRDYLSDLRRHEGSVASSKANRAAERATAVQIGSTIAQLATAYAAPGLAPVIGAGINVGAQALTQQQSSANQYGQGVQSAMAGVPSQQPIGGGQTISDPGALDLQPQTGAASVLAPESGGAPLAGGAGAPPQGPGGPPGGPGGPPGGGEPIAAPLQGQGGAAAAPSPLAAGQQQGQPNAAAPAIAAQSQAMATPATGMDGDFSHTSYARQAAASSSITPGSSMVATSMNHYIADLYEQDAFYQSLPVALTHRWRQRMRASV